MNPRQFGSLVVLVLSLVSVPLLLEPGLADLVSYQSLGADSGLTLKSGAAITTGS